jgi:hypothetical protein
MTEPTPPNPGKGKQYPDVFNPKADIRGGRVVFPGGIVSEGVGRAPADAPPQQPGPQNHYMGKKAKADDPKTAALLRRLKGKDSK